MCECQKVTDGFYAANTGPPSGRIQMAAPGKPKGQRSRRIYHKERIARRVKENDKSYNIQGMHFRV